MISLEKHKFPSFLVEKVHEKAAFTNKNTFCGVTFLKIERMLGFSKVWKIWVRSSIMRDDSAERKKKENEEERVGLYRQRGRPFVSPSLSYSIHEKPAGREPKAHHDSRRSPFRSEAQMHTKETRRMA